MTIGKRPDLNIDNETEKNVENNENENRTSILYGIEQALLEEEPIPSSEEVTMENFFSTTKDDYDKFDERCWKKGDGYKIPSFPMIEEKLEGVESGLYLFAGESNSGKSAIMMNILKDMCSYRPNKLFGIYYSLDDTKNEIIPRIISMEQEIPISVSSKPKRYENMIENCDNDNVALYENYLEKRQIGLDKLKSESDIFKVEDTSKIKNSTDLKKHLETLQTFIKSIDPEMNVVAAIDAYNDIKLDSKVYKDNKAEDQATYIKDLTTDLDIIIFSSTHLRKLNGNRRPSLDDLREANTLVYEASVIWLVYNDVSKNKGNAKIYWNDSNVENNIGAVIELDWAKNKKSSFKGRTFNLFLPYYSLCKECNKDMVNRFESLIYQE